MINIVLEGSSSSCIGSNVSRLGGIASTFSGLGDSGCGLDFGFEVDDVGLRGSLERLLLKVINDGGIPCHLECFYTISSCFAGIDVLGPSRFRFESGLETSTRCSSPMRFSVCSFAPTVPATDMILTLFCVVPRRLVR